MATLKERITAGETTIGSWITIGHTAVAELMAGCGFDWLTVDLEHSVITLDIAQDLIRTISGAGVTPLVRVGENDPTVIKRVMDAGANGVIVPMVNSAADAERAVASAKYPPRGTRGVGLARAQGYGFTFPEYREWVERESVVIVQVEHIDAVEALPEILSTEGVDGFIVGPYDLSASMGVPGEFERPEVAKALARVEQVAAERDAVAGFHVIPPDADKLLEKARAGYRFLGFSLDTLYLGTIARAELAKVRGAL